LWKVTSDGIYACCGAGPVDPLVANVGVSFMETGLDPSSPSSNSSIRSAALTPI
jgi:hypothetical protein